ncbi:MAG TPA: S1 RNA-binding domain-containing protein [Terriglobales bacterium]|nr:S1 RNA-binding domain-containing protein [Terriglobales bacterium]
MPEPSSAPELDPSLNPPPADSSLDAPEANFAELLAAYEAQHESPAEKAGPAPGEHRSGQVVSVREDVVLVDIGAKAEGVLPLDLWRSQGPGTELHAGDTVEIVVEGRDPEGSFKLTPFTPDRPRNLEDARAAFANGTILRGKVTGAVKGGLTVDVGMRGFIPFSKTGVPDPDQLHKLVGQQIRCRIARQPDEKNLVLDRRTIVEQEHREAQKQTLEHLQEGDEVEGTVKSLATYGAFIDIGGIDALLHISDMSWTRLAEPGQLLSLGLPVRVKVLKIERGKRRVSVGLRQLTPDPWAGVGERYEVGARVRGPVTRTSDFGAFVEIEPGVEGLIHISEMSWSKRIRKPEDAVKVGEVVEAVVLGVNLKDRRISLGLKQALGDPWADAETIYKVGNVVEGKVRNLQPFGAFLEIAEGVDGMVHIGDISVDRIQHPSAVLKLGDVVRAQVLEMDRAKRRLRLGMKQLEPTAMDKFVAAHAVDEVISGRVVKAFPGRVQLDEGIEASCPSATAPVRQIEEGTFAAKLRAVSKQPARVEAVPDTPRVELKSGEVRKFRITKLDAEHSKIEVALA